MDILKRNNVTVIGSGKPILFAHGYGCSQTMWRNMVPYFENKYQVILFDHVGAGKSVTSEYSKDKYSNLKGYADDVIEICEALNLRQSIFVGHSVSSMIGVLAANNRPDLFSELVLISPSPCYINDGTYVGGFERRDIDGLLSMLDSNYLGWSSTITPVIMGNSDQPELTNELNDSFCSTDPAIASHFAHVTFYGDNRNDLKNVSHPTLILQCAEDAIAPVIVGKYVAEKITNSKFVMLEATGHCPHLSAPTETSNAILSHINTEVLIDIR